MSVYYTLKNGTKYSESNCTLTSIFTALSYLQASNNTYRDFPNIGTETIFDATTDSFYDQFNKSDKYDIAPPKKIPLCIVILDNML